MNGSLRDPKKTGVLETFFLQWLNVRGGNKDLAASFQQKPEKKPLPLPVQFSSHVIQEQNR